MPEIKYEKTKRKDGKSDKTSLLIILISALVVIAVIILLLLRGCDSLGIEPILKNDGDPSLPSPSKIEYDTGAVIGGWESADIEKIVEGLNKQVEDGMINISMNTTPYFENGASDGSLMIVNEEVNRYPQVVEIYRNDTGEMIYKSGAIPVGSKIERAKLSVELAKGKYECTAYFYSVDPVTGSYLGCAGAIINISIKN